MLLLSFCGTISEKDDETMKYLCESYTDKGGRENNEDSLLVFGSPNGILLVVADGLGGHECGEVASGIAVDTLREEFAREPFDPVSAIKLANSRILQRQAETGKEMKTTVCAAWINGGVQLCHVGDSRIYALRAGDIVYQSVDHSASQMAVTVGEITPAEIRNHPDRNKLVRALGVGEEVKVDSVCLADDGYDALLLCTDGFWEYVLEDEIVSSLASADSPETWLSAMRALLPARVPEGNDNNTAIVLMRDGDMR